MINIKIHKLREDVIIPKYAYDSDAGMDVYSTKNCLLLPKHRVLVGTGLRIEIPKGYEMQIRPKSGLALRDGITVLNTPGTIDSSYRGEVGIVLINHSSKQYRIEKNQKIAQIVFNKIEKAKLIVTKELSETKRGEGGFGSTGLNVHKKPNKTVFRTNFSKVYS